MKKKILIINQFQFGYHIDYVQYCRYLKDEYDITFLCWQYNFEIVSQAGVFIKYISRDGNKIARNTRFILSALQTIRRSKYDYIIVHYFIGCFIFPLCFSKRKIHLDIRSGKISDDIFRRNFFNLLMRWESCFFKSISIISEGLQHHLKISKKAFILPLGASPMRLRRRLEHQASLLYVGTLTGRRIEDTILGTKIYLQQNPNACLSYTIIGNGWADEVEKLRSIVKENKLERFVFIEGYIPHNDLKKYYKKSNIGVSYIPITEYFNFQPATKTYEYLMAGMPVIATGTYENKKIINSQNGVIISDTPEDFAHSIFKITQNMSCYKEKNIRDSVSGYNWTEVVHKLKKEFLI